ncbi:hypothetical protein BJX61DRAFT_512925 [Aspergillus egyptiacus]|nr:hypothetical protein BJX61DRAFT_512925 [Aspergillus egyptiacus]
MRMLLALAGCPRRCESRTTGRGTEVNMSCSRVQTEMIFVPKRRKKRKGKKKSKPNAGVEPATLRLRVSRSAD